MKSENSNLIMLYVTINDQILAREIAKELVLQKLVACVNIIPKISSLYIWQNELYEDEEMILLCKMSEDLKEKAINAIKKLHNYHTPCILAFNIDDGEKNFLKWIVNSINCDISNK